LGFSGGGTNVLKPHTHDGSISQDGGSLNMDNVTQASLTAGDTVYSDGSHLQRLAIGTPGQSMTVSGSNIPSWTSASGAASELIGTATASGSTSFIEVTFTAISEGDIAYIFGVFSGESSGGQGSELVVNGVTSNYNQQGIVVTGGAATYPRIIGETHFDLDNSNLGQDETAYFNLKINPYDDQLSAVMWTVGDNPGLAYNCGKNTGTWTEYNAVRVRTADGANIPANTVLEVWKMNNS
jgi:hypothetical protein